MPWSVPADIPNPERTKKNQVTRVVILACHSSKHCMNRVLTDRFPGKATIVLKRFDGVTCS